MAHHEIVIAGFGGQGLLFIGKILAYAGLVEKRQLSWLRGKADVHWHLWKKETNYQEACLFSTRILENSGII